MNKKTCYIVHETADILQETYDMIQRTCDMKDEPYRTVHVTWKCYKIIFTWTREPFEGAEMISEDMQWVSIKMANKTQVEQIPQMKVDVRALSVIKTEISHSDKKWFVPLKKLWFFVRLENLKISL